MSVFKRCESEPGSFASGEEEVWGDGVSEGGDERRRAGVVWIVRKGDMRSEPVRACVRVSGDGMRDVIGRMGREPRGAIVRKRGMR